MPSTSDRQRALALISLDHGWSNLKIGRTVTDQASTLIRAPGQAHRTPLETGIKSLAEQVEADGHQRAERGLELAYHNREHIRDVLVALKLLVEASDKHLSQGDVQVTALAMVGHDLGHDGLPNRSLRELEIQSWKMVHALLKPLALGRQTLTRIRTLILMTDPSGYPGLAQRQRRSALSSQMALAVDADLFASLLPSRGFSLGASLADEQVRAGIPQAKTLATLQGRAGFLKFVPLLSDAIRALGMQSLIEAQLSVIHQLSETDRMRPWTPSWGDEFTGRVQDHLTRDIDGEN